MEGTGDPARRVVGITTLNPKMAGRDAESGGWTDEGGVAGGELGGEDNGDEVSDEASAALHSLAVATVFTSAGRTREGCGSPVKGSGELEIVRL
jgi:hypothetical protein